MSQITENIFLGNDNNAQDREFITNNEIQLIINVTNNIPNHFNDIEYLNLKIEDSIEENIYNRFSLIIDKMNTTKKLLIHCNRGKSRSASFVLAYLMKYMGMDLKTAYEYIKLRRDIQPNIEFFRQLTDYDLLLYGKKSMTVWEYMNMSIAEYLEFVKTFHHNKNN